MACACGCSPNPATAYACILQRRKNPAVYLVHGSSSNPTMRLPPMSCACTLHASHLVHKGFPNPTTCRSPSLRDMHPFEAGRPRDSPGPWGWVELHGESIPRFDSPRAWGLAGVPHSNSTCVWGSGEPHGTLIPMSCAYTTPCTSACAWGLAKPRPPGNTSIPMSCAFIPNATRLVHGDSTKQTPRPGKPRHSPCPWDLGQTPWRVDPPF